MGEMINNIAHQWRQPLNALGLVLGNLKDAAQFNEFTESYLDSQIDDGLLCIEKMSSTINDFRNFFRPDKQKELFSLRKAIQSAIALVDASFKTHNIEFIVDAPDDIKAMGFPNEYSQVLLNLITNAKEAILTKGQNGNGGYITVRLHSDHDFTHTIVTDSGGGIRDDVLDRLFEPYFSTKEGGSGIGLYMSKMIIENSMNGKISVRNVPQGAEFTISMPNKCAT